MEHTEDNVPSAAPDSRLKEAIHRAREAQAERTDVQSDMRGAEIARLEVLFGNLGDSLTVVPADNDMFEIVLSKGSRPRLWIDMLAFVVMGRDRRTYRFMRDTREGRQVLFESTDPETVSSRIHDYAAHRIIEREKALEAAGDFAVAAQDTESEDSADTALVVAEGRGRFGSAIASFILGVVAGIVLLLAYGYVQIP